MSNIKDPNAPDPNAVQATKPPEELTPIVRLKSQEEINSEVTLVRLEMESLKLEKEKLEIEKLRNDVLEIRRGQEAQRIARDTVQESLSFERDTRINNETLCTHMKGGSSEHMMHGAPAQGNDASNYAFIDHTLTTGIRFRLCQRCGRTYFPKDPDYRWAMTRPTRNSPSTGSPSPGLVRNPKNVRVVSELPHRQPPQQDWDFNGVPDYSQSQ